MDTLNIYYDRIGSTNSEAKNILLKHNIKKAVIIADEQTSGKGRYGNKWISKKGNLYMSLVFQVKSYNHIKLLQFKILKLLKSVISNLLSEKSHIKVKHPNDILIQNRKISGILIESINCYSKLYAIVGIGVNINNSPSINKWKTIHLNKLLKIKVKPKEIAKKIRKKIKI